MTRAFPTAKLIRQQIRGSAMSRIGGSCSFRIHHDRVAAVATFVLILGIVAQPVGLSAHAAAAVQRNSQFTTFPPVIFGPSAAQPEPLRRPDSSLEPIEWYALKGWSSDEHAAAFANSVTNCRP